MGGWVETQRSSYNAETLAPEIIARLESLPGWVWDANEAAWEDGFASLEKYIARVGNARPPDRYEDEDGYPLGRWVRTQRGRYKSGTLNPPERIARLEILPGGVWDARA